MATHQTTWVMGLLKLAIEILSCVCRSIIYMNSIKSTFTSSRQTNDSYHVGVELTETNFALRWHWHSSHRRHTRSPRHTGIRTGANRHCHKHHSYTHLNIHLFSKQNRSFQLNSFFSLQKKKKKNTNTFSFLMHNQTFFLRFILEKKLTWLRARVRECAEIPIKLRAMHF